MSSSDPTTLGAAPVAGNDRRGRVAHRVIGVRGVLTS